MADSGGKMKSKNQKKREKKKEQSQHKTPVKNENDNDAIKDTEAEFERELSWCIQQLTIGLTSNQQKYTHKQAQSAVDALRSLNNQKTPFIKKRQVMRVNFGDYRTKMAEEENKYYANLKKPSVETKPSTEQKCKFLKRAYVPENSKEQATSERSQEDVGDFKFNFNVNEQGEGDTGSSQEANSTENPADGGGDTKNDTGPQPEVNYYKMPVSSDKSDFKFNFNIS